MRAHVWSPCFQVFLVWSHCRVSLTWGTWEGVWQLSFCVTSLAWPPLPLWGGAARCLVALALACLPVRCPDCRRACLPAGGVLS